MYKYIFLNLIFPLVFLITGYLLKKFPPKDINSYAGYRTQRAKKNIETWNEASKYSARLLIYFSLLSEVLTIISLFILGKSYILEGAGVFIAMSLMIISLVLIVILTENHLKNIFEK